MLDGEIVYIHVAYAPDEPSAVVNFFDNYQLILTATMWTLILSTLLSAISMWLWTAIRTKNFLDFITMALGAKISQLGSIILIYWIRGARWTRILKTLQVPSVKIDWMTAFLQLVLCKKIWTQSSTSATNDGILKTIFLLNFGFTRNLCLEESSRHGDFLRGSSTTLLFKNT